MYRVEYLLSAKQDLSEIALYIRDELCNPTAAINLVEEIIKVSERHANYPYSNPVYIPIKPLKNEYRKILVKNYMLFYTVDETQKIVTISRIIYAKRNLNTQIKDTDN
ncbi:MAG: type II toxin-antitoxin system RelE/ParE family toxin [Ruminococcus sp.]|nr:type II toxin-antitoxin system RelE/ParE family toxin [Ruminococcus sp.]